MHQALCQTLRTAKWKTGETRGCNPTKAKLLWSSPRAASEREGPSNQKTLQSNSSPLLVLLNSVNRVFVDIQSYSQYNLFPFLSASLHPQPGLAFFLQLPPESCPNLLHFSFLYFRENVFLVLVLISLMSSKHFFLLLVFSPQLWFYITAKKNPGKGDCHAQNRKIGGSWVEEPL